MDSNINKEYSAIEGLKRLREPFSADQINKLPKPTKAQTECAYQEKVRCDICGGFHHPRVIHLDYVGHAALTNRLLEVDPHWNWEPLSCDESNMPLLSKETGLWIKLTVCGVTRLGFGSADGKKGGDAIKECIGDALRNAAMRFGAALDLWHKGDSLFLDEDNNDKKNNSDKELNSKKIDATQINTLTDMCAKLEVNIAAFCKHLKVSKIGDLPAEKFSYAMSALKDKEKEQKQELEDIQQ